MTTSNSALLRYAMIISLQKLTRDKIKYIRHKNKRDTETQQENAREY